MKRVRWFDRVGLAVLAFAWMLAAWTAPARACVDLLWWLRR